MSDDSMHALDMLGAAKAIQVFMTNRSREEFYADDMLQSAVLHKFMIVGEACRRVSVPFRDAHPQVDWVGITGFRNQIVHEYDDVNLDIVWEIIHAHLPLMCAALAAIVPERPDGEEV